MSPDTLVRRTGNRLIDSLPKDVAKRLSFLENSEDVRQGDVVYRQDVPTSHVYFPVSAVYSHVVPLKDGNAFRRSPLETRVCSACISCSGLISARR